jgi:DNA-binding beta-propeller fold protein YncE
VARPGRLRHGDRGGGAGVGDASRGGGRDRSGPAPRVIATTAIGQYPAGLAVNPRTGTVYVLNNYSSGSDRVAVLNPRTNKIATTIPIKGNVRNPAPMLAVSPVTGDIYVNGTHTYSPSQSWVGGAVTAISGRTNKIIATIDFPQNSTMSMAVSPVTGKVYAEDGGCTRESQCTSTVAVISGQTNKIIGRDSFDSILGQIAFGSKTGDVYVTGANSQEIAVIIGQTNKVIDSIGFPACEPSGVGALGSPGQFAISPRTGNLYVPIASGNDCQTYSVQVVSSQTNKIIGAVRLPTPGQQIAADPVTGEIYVLRPQTLTSVDGEVPPSVASVISD